MTIIKIGEHYISSDRVAFGYADLSLDINDAVVFNSDQEAEEFISLLNMQCEFQLITKE